jgi:hypothetical protein
MTDAPRKGDTPTMSNDDRRHRSHLPIPTPERMRSAKTISIPRDARVPLGDAADELSEQVPEPRPLAVLSEALLVDVDDRLRFKGQDCYQAERSYCPMSLCRRWCSPLQYCPQHYLGKLPQSRRLRFAWRLYPSLYFREQKKRFHDPYCYSPGCSERYYCLESLHQKAYRRLHCC